MKFRKDERGVVFVEAAVVFPIMFIIVFLMIYTGNVYWQRCKVEALVTDYAFRGAAYCADPLLTSAQTGSIPSLGNHQVYPYRIFDKRGMQSTADNVAGELETAIKSVGNGLFKGMKPKNVNVEPSYENFVIYSTLSFDVDYKIELPIRMIGQKENYCLDFSTRIELPVSDVPEMIRTVDMVEDYLQQTGVTEEFQKFLGKVKEWMGS